MGSHIAVTYSCDWINEFGHDCPTTATFEGKYHENDALADGWGWRNTTFRDAERPMWHTSYTWFCPLHATLFGRNHGWEDRESIKPPKHWENGPVRRKTNSF